ncbi:MAG: NifB/NifX family molybdenum-iron cluster-binding protein [Theionarchaea archaeon]|nr:NifB/NifX family molybdenum-iron cluster-binding protein [Theionarchaea archaeon]
MKVAVCAVDQGLEAELASRFGRCKYFVVIDTETTNVAAIPNAGGKTGEGAGVQAAQILINEDVEAVIGTSFGPNAFMTLKYAGIKVYNGKGTVSEVLEQFKDEKLEEMEQSNVPKKAGHFTR